MTRTNDQFDVVQTPWPQPAAPMHFMLRPKEGQQVVGGELLPAVEAHKLDTAGMPPSLYQEVRDDLSVLVSIPCTRIALTRANHAYVGIIDSNGVPYFFRLSSTGVVTKSVKDTDAAWRAFDRLMDVERSAARQQRRGVADKEMLGFVVKGQRAKPYGHTAYTRRTKSGKLVQVKAKGVRLDDLARHKNARGLFHDRNPFERNKEFMDEHDLWNILNAAKVTSVTAAKRILRPHMHRMFGISERKHDVNNAVQQVIDHLHKYGVFTLPSKQKKTPKQRVASTQPNNKQPLQVSDFVWSEFETAINEILNPQVRVRDGRIDLEPDQKAMQFLRDGARAILEGHGVDIKRSSDQPLSGVLVPDPALEYRGAPPAFHSWKGDVHMSRNLMTLLGLSFTSLAQSTPQLTPGKAIGLTLLLHEELHGCSNIEPTAYRGLGVMIEEVTTELAARDITVRMFGDVLSNITDRVTLRDDLASRSTTTEGRLGAGYQEYIDRLVNVVSHVFWDINTSEILPLLTRVSLEMKGPSKELPARTPDEHVRRFAVAVTRATGLKGAAAAKKVDQLVTVLNTYAPPELKPSSP